MRKSTRGVIRTGTIEPVVGAESWLELPTSDVAIDGHLAKRTNESSWCAREWGWLDRSAHDELYTTTSRERRASCEARQSVALS